MDCCVVLWGCQGVCFVVCWIRFLILAPFCIDPSSDVFSFAFLFPLTRGPISIVSIAPRLARSNSWKFMKNLLPGGTV